MDQHFRNYQTNLKFLEKGRGYYCWEPRKRKIKTKNFSETTQSPQYNRAGRARTVEEMFQRKLTNKIKN